MGSSPVSVVGHQCENCDQIDYIIESMEFVPLGRILLIIWEKIISEKFLLIVVKQRFGNH